MSDTIQILSVALNRDMDALKQVSQNLTNTHTSGYKSVSNVQSMDFSSNVLSTETEKNTKQLNFNWQNGTLKPTERALDVAITGNAFFTIKMNNALLYTRNGSFHLNNEGMLMTKSGQPVLSESGEVYLSDPNNIKISETGIVSQNGEEQAQLKLISFINTDNIEAIGSGIWQTSESNTTISEKFSITQGYLETSNVDATAEMVKMMELSKHFSSVQKALLAYDQMQDIGINKFGQ